MLLLAAPVMGEQVFTLDKCLETGLEKNPTMKSAELMVDWADQEKNVAFGQFLPSLSADGNFTNLVNDRSSGPSDDDAIDQNNYGYGVRLSQILYAGSRVFNTYSRTEAQREMYMAQKQYTRLEVIYKIEAAFFELKKAEQDVAAAEDTVKRLQSGLKAAEAYYKQSMAPYVQVLLAKVDLADAEQALSKIKNNVDKKRVDLFTLMNIPYDPSVKFSGGLEYYKSGYTTDFDKCWEKASKNRSDLKSLEQQIVMAEKSAAIAMGKYLPTIRVDYGYYDQTRDYEDPGRTLTGKYDRDQQNCYWRAGATASWQLFDGGSAWFERKKSLIEINRIKEQIKDAENKIMGGIRSILFSVSESESRLKVTATAVEAAKEYYASEEKRFRAGISTIPSLLDAQARLTKADANHNQAMLDYQIARSGINYMTGETGR